MLISKWSQRADPSVQESLANSSACLLMALCRALKVTVGCERSRRRPHPPHPNTHKHMALCHRVHDTCPERQANFVSRALLGPITCSCRSSLNVPFFVQWRDILFIWMCSACSDSTSETGSILTISVTSFNLSMLAKYRTQSCLILMVQPL